MKTPEEYIKRGFENIPAIGMFDEYSFCEIIEIMEIMQKDAYNQAIDDAAENAEFDFDGQEHIEKVWIDKQSILKLKKT